MVSTVYLPLWEFVSWDDDIPRRIRFGESWWIPRWAIWEPTAIGQLKGHRRWEEFRPRKCHTYGMYGMHGISMYLVYIYIYIPLCIMCIYIYIICIHIVYLIIYTHNMIWYMVSLVIPPSLDSKHNRYNSPCWGSDDHPPIWRFPVTQF